MMMLFLMRSRVFVDMITRLVRKSEESLYILVIIIIYAML